MPTEILRDCDDAGFKIKQTWSYTAIALVIVSGLYVLIDAIKHKEKRKVPGKLMMSRMLIDVIWALCFFYMVLDINCDDIKTHPDLCRPLGTIFVFLFLLSLMYYSGLCWDMYFTLMNPFRKAMSDSWQLHLFSIIVSLSISLTVTFDNGYRYRKDYQICWTENTSQKISIDNVIILYIPLGAVIVGGLGITIWAVQRLKQRMLEETFALRWSVIKRQIAIVTFFTVNYLIAACIWSPIVWVTFNTDEYGKYGAEPSNQPYLLSITIVLTVFFDVIAWIAKDSTSCRIFRAPINMVVAFSTANSTYYDNSAIIEYKIEENFQSPKDERREPLLSESGDKSLLESNSLNSSLFTSSGSSKLEYVDKVNIQTTKQKTPNLSNALRREVIVFMTHGLVQAAKRTAKETMDTQSDSHLDIFDADFDFNHTLQSTITTKQVYKTPDEMDGAAHEQLYEDSDDEDRDEQNEKKMSQEDIMLSIPEPIPQKVYFPYSIHKKPEQQRGAIDRFNIQIPGSNGDAVPFTSFGMHVFRYLRTKCYGISDKQYIESILPETSECIGEIVANFSEGRSGAFFFYTKDNKYLIKTLHADEAQLLVQILPDYMNYYIKNQGSYLAKFLGLHSIKLYSLVIYFVVMSNVFPPNIDPQETYDIVECHLYIFIFCVGKRHLIRKGAGCPGIQIIILMRGS